MAGRKGDMFDIQRNHATDGCIDKCPETVCLRVHSDFSKSLDEAYTTPSCRRPSTSLAPIFSQSASTSAVCCPNTGGGE